VAAWEITTGAIAFDAPFGPTVLDLAAEVPSGSGTLLDQFLRSLGLPNRATFDAALSPSQKNAAIEGLVNSQIQPLGYSPLGLADSGLDYSVEVGGAAATFTYGWSEFEIHPTSRALRVTTYGIPAYTRAQMNEETLLRQPQVVSRFTVQSERPRLEIRRVAGRIRAAWRRAFAGFRLERSASLGVDAAWEAVEATVDGEEMVAELPEGAASFYRLRLQ
jgi:hypothetical protein